MRSPSSGKTGAGGPETPPMALEDLTNNEIAVSTRLQLVEAIPELIQTGELNRDESVEKLKASWIACSV